MATDGANEDREPLKYFPDVGDTVKDDTLRKFSDPIGGQYRGSDARDAIESFLRARAGELKSGDLDVREESADEGANTLRIRYTQYLNDLPILGKGIHASADIARKAVTNVSNKLDESVAGAPDPAKARPLDAATATALRPFEADYGTAQVIGSRLAYLRDDSRPQIPEADYPTATRELLQTGVRADGKLHLIYEIQVETGDPFERFRVIVDAMTGRLRFIELLGRYVSVTGSVFMPDPVSESNSGTLSSTSTAATLNPFRHTVTFEVAPSNRWSVPPRGRLVPSRRLGRADAGGALRDHCELLLHDVPGEPALPERQHLLLARQLRALPAHARERDDQRQHVPRRRRLAGLQRGRQQRVGPRHAESDPLRRGRRPGCRRLRRRHPRVPARRLRLPRQQPRRLRLVRAQLLRRHRRDLPRSAQSCAPPPHGDVPVRQQRDRPMEHRAHPRPDGALRRRRLRGLRPQPAQLDARHRYLADATSPSVAIPATPRCVSGRRTSSSGRSSRHC